MQVSIKLKDVLDRFRDEAGFPPRRQYLCTFIRDEILALPPEVSMVNCENAIRDLFAQYFVPTPFYMSKCTLGNWFTTEIEDEHYTIQPVGEEVMIINNPYRDAVKFRILLMEEILMRDAEVCLNFSLG